MSADENNYAQWVDRAEEDRLAIHNSLGADRIPWRVICFLAQQAAEKLLKGFLVHHGREFRRTHDLVALLQECCRVDPSLGQLERECLGLTPHAVSGRYPDFEHEGWALDGHEAVEAMERVRSAILRRLPQQSA